MNGGMMIIARVPLSAGPDLPDGWSWWTTNARFRNGSATRSVCPVNPDTVTEGEWIPVGEPVLKAVREMPMPPWVFSGMGTWIIRSDEWWGGDLPGNADVRIESVTGSRCVVSVSNLPKDTCPQPGWDLSFYRDVVPAASTPALPTESTAPWLTWDDRKVWWDETRRDWYRRVPEPPWSTASDDRIARADDGMKIPDGWVMCRPPDSPPVIDPWDEGIGPEIGQTRRWWIDTLAWYGTSNTRIEDADRLWATVLPCDHNVITVIRDEETWEARRGVDAATDPWPVRRASRDAAIADAAGRITSDREKHDALRPATGWPAVWVVSPPPGMSRGGWVDRRRAWWRSDIRDYPIRHFNDKMDILDDRETQ